MKDQRIGAYTLSCKRWRFRTEEVMALLRLTYWAKDRDRRTVRRSLRHSVPFGVFDAAGCLVGFLRITSDRATVYYLSDVVLREDTRGQGLGLALVRYALSNPTLCRGKGLLLTTTAAGLYEKLGFQADRDRLMIRPPV